MTQEAGPRARRVAIARWLTALVICLVAAAGWSAQANASVFWGNSDGDSIGRANLDGTNVDQNLMTGFSPGGLAIEGNYIYWSNADQSGNSIGRATLSGTEVEPEFIPGLFEISSVAVSGSYIYWTAGGFAVPTIGRAKLNGTDVEPDFITLPQDDEHGSDGIAVNGSYIYFSQPEIGASMDANTGTIARANLNGSGVDENFITHAEDPNELVLDGSHIYWSTSLDGFGDLGPGHTIGRANMDASNVEPAYITTGTPTEGIAVDSSSLYWAGGTNDTIGRVDLDGTNINPNYITGATVPEGVAVVPAPIATIQTPINGAHYAEGASVVVAYGCSTPRLPPALVVSCVGPVTNGQPIDTSSPGAKTFTVTATDDLGDTAISTVNYTVEAGSGAGGSGGSGNSGSSGGSSGSSGSGGSSGGGSGTSSIATAATPTIGKSSASGMSASVLVSCAGASGSTCGITVSLYVTETLKVGKVTAVTAKTKAKPKTTKRTVTIGMTTVTLSAGQSKTVSVKLNAAGLALLSKQHHLPAILTVLSGAKTLATQTVNLAQAASKTKSKHK